MRSPIIATATEEDLPELWSLECACFEPARRSSRRSLRHSLASRRQIVRIVRDAPGQPVMASAILMKHAFSWRITSMAVALEARGRGLGKTLIADAIAQAETAGAGWLNLEADALDRDLIEWYECQGFVLVRRRDDYYGPGRPALRMRRRLVPAFGEKASGAR